MFDRESKNEDLDDTLGLVYDNEHTRMSHYPVNSVRDSQSVYLPATSNYDVHLNSDQYLGMSYINTQNDEKKLPMTYDINREEKPLKANPLTFD